MVLKTNLIGDEQTVLERLRIYRDASIHTFRVGLHGDTLHQRGETLERFMDLVRQLNARDVAAD